MVVVKVFELHGMTRKPGIMCKVHAVIILFESVYAV